MTKILAIALLLVTVVAGVFGWLWHDRGLEMATLNQKLSTQQGDTRTLQSANTDQAKTITQLESMLDIANAQLASDEAANDQAKASLADTQTKLNQAEQLAQSIRNQLYAHDKTAAAWAASPIPAAVSDQLRQQWQDASGVPSPADQGATDNAAPVGGDRPQPDGTPRPGAAATPGRA